MYEQFFGFRERPFDLTPNPRFVVMTAAHREALSNLEYGILSRKGITMLLGEAGTGKTTVIRTAIERQTKRVWFVHIPNPALTRDEFVEMLAAKFELSDQARTSKASLLRELEALLLQRRAADETTVLIIDEAQSLPHDLLEEVRLLANIETNEEKLLSVIIAGQPELSERLNDDSLRQLKQRVALRCELGVLGLAETAAYLAGRIRAAGGVGAQVFTREAVTLIHERSSGIPRTINVLADNALLSAFAVGERPVTRQTVLDVCQDFDLQEAADATAVVETPTNASVTMDDATAETGGSQRLLSSLAPSKAPANDPGVAAGSAAERSDTNVSVGEAPGPKRRRFSFFRG
jgi:type II secretory pathway predicted ATPase ExeA